MHVNGLSVLNRFDLLVYHCIVSPVIAHVLQLPVVSPTAVIQAEYEGICFIADVNLELLTVTWSLERNGLHCCAW